MASLLKVDALTGVTTAGSISVTGEGNSTTTNLQQGLAKSWLNYDQASNVARDSSNISSVVDNSTSEFETNFTNVTNNIYYSVYGSFNMNYSVAGALGYAMHTDGVAERTPTTSDFFVRTINFSGSGYDAKYNMMSVHGDLA